MKKKFIVIFGLFCLAISLFFVFKNDNVQVVHDKYIASVSNNTASASGSTAPKIKTMYRILEFNGDTTVWDSADCVIRDSSFSCKKEIIQDLSDIVNKKFINKIHEDFSSIYKNMSILDEALENHKKNKTGNTLPSSHIKENSTNIPTFAYSPFRWLSGTGVTGSFAGSMGGSWSRNAFNSVSGNTS